jgi:DNA-binding transcriptional regulator YdaS (Cro superfamily)
METKIKDAIKRAGGATYIASHFGISPVSVYEWISSGKVPAERCPEIEKLTRRKVRCEELNSRIDWAYVRRTGRLK